jgi:hypothetical protein
MPQVGVSALPIRYAIFCADPLNPRSAEPDFAVEVAAAREAGFAPILLDHDALDHRVDAAEALRKARIAEPGRAIYRGWMLRSEAYRALYDALLARGVQLITEPEAYNACHHAPGSYAALQEFTPNTAWVTEDKLGDNAAIHAALRSFGTSAVIIKDWVKSQAAGYWSEACFIPNAADIDQASRVIERFAKIQGASLVGGIVFKAYVPLRPEGKPADEHRAFIVGGRVVGCWPRTDAAGCHAGPPQELLTQVASKVPSPFASADFGVDNAEQWWLLEVGDGQVSGLPSEGVAASLFQAIAAQIPEESE